MLFRSNVLAPEGFAAGRWNFLQLWNQNRSIIDDIDGPLIAPNNALWGIDNEQLYPAYVVNDGYTVWAGTSWPAAGTMHATVDTPSQGLGHLSYASINDQFIMYVMFMPPGGNSKWVPLRSLYWAFAVNATKNVGAWQLGGGNYHNAAGWKTEATSPEWTITHVNNSAFVADP